MLLCPLLGAHAQFERTPLHSAAASGDANAIKSLVKDGASLEARSGAPKWTPLYLAVEEGHTEAARALMEAGASLEAQDDGKWRPLHVAAHRLLEVLVVNLKALNQIPKQPQKIAKGGFMLRGNLVRLHFIG